MVEGGGGGGQDNSSDLVCLYPELRESSLCGAQ
jgi:hypothetical protein